MKFHNREELLYLSVGQHGGIVATEAAFYEPVHASVVHILLWGGHVEHIVVGEGLVGPQPHLGLTGSD